jgi:hypothetical protein
MSGETTPDLTLLVRQQRQVIAEMSSLRDDMGVMVAILQRLDGTVGGLVSEVRATHSQNSRLRARVEALERNPAEPADRPSTEEGR